jgi:hypothetical protein
LGRYLDFIRFAAKAGTIGLFSMHDRGPLAYPLHMQTVAP